MGYCRFLGKPYLSLQFLPCRAHDVIVNFLRDGGYQEVPQDRYEDVVKALWAEAQHDRSIAPFLEDPVHLSAAWVNRRRETLRVEICDYDMEALVLAACYSALPDVDVHDRLQTTAAGQFIDRVAMVNLQL